MTTPACIVLSKLKIYMSLGRSMGIHVEDLKVACTWEQVAKSMPFAQAGGPTHWAVGVTEKGF